MCRTYVRLTPPLSCLQHVECFRGHQAVSMLFRRLLRCDGDVRLPPPCTRALLQDSHWQGCISKIPLASLEMVKMLLCGWWQRQCI